MTRLRMCPECVGGGYRLPDVADAARADDEAPGGVSVVRTDTADLCPKCDGDGVV